MRRRTISLLLALTLAGGTTAGAEQALEEYIPAQVQDEVTEEQISVQTEENEKLPAEEIEEITGEPTDAYVVENGEDGGVHLLLDFQSQVPVLKSISGTDSTVKLTWLAVSGADRYHIYRQKVGANGWDNIGASKSTSYTDPTADGQTSYYYAIRAIKGDEKKYIRTERSGSYLRVGRPKLYLAEESSNGIKIWWKASEGSRKYYVYRRKKGAKNWRELATTSGTDYEDKTAKMGHSYEYTVRASCSNGGVEFQSGRSTSGVGATRMLRVPKITALSGTETQVTLKWEKTTGAQSYYVYRMQSGGEWKEIGSTTARSYIDKTAKASVTYRYRVRAGRKMRDGSIALGGYQTPGIQRPGKTVLTSAESEQRGIRVRWEPVASVKEYRVYRKESPSSKWVFLGTTDHKYYLDQNVTFKSYYYTVRAVGLNPTTFYGGFDKNGIEGKYTYGIVKMQTLTNTTDGIKVSWEKRKGATGYQIFRRAAGESSWRRIQTVSGGNTLSCLDNNVKSGVRYFYTVGSVRNGKEHGYDQSGISIRRLASPKLSEVTRGKESLRISWKKVAGANAYEVYRSVGGAAWEKYADVKNVSAYTDTAVSNGKWYRYSVRARRDSDLSGYDQNGIGRIYLRAVEITAVRHIENGQVELRWSANSQADRYVVSYATSANFAKDTRISVSNNAATVKNLKKGEIYYFRVNALKEHGKEKHFSLWSNASMVAIEH